MAETIPNSVFLKGIHCPQCGSLAPFELGPLPTTLKVYDNTIEAIGLARWNDEDDILCRKCGHSGVVGDFRGKAMPDDYNMKTSGGNEAVARMVCCALEAIEQGRRSSEVNVLLQRTIELIHGQHPEVTSLTVRDSIFNALAPAYRQQYKVGLPHSAIAERTCSSCCYPLSQHYGRGECP